MTYKHEHRNDQQQIFIKHHTHRHTTAQHNHNIQQQKQQQRSNRTPLSASSSHHQINNQNIDITDNTSSSISHNDVSILDATRRCGIMRVVPDSTLFVLLCHCVLVTLLNAVFNRVARRSSTTSSMATFFSTGGTSSAAAAGDVGASRRTNTSIFATALDEETDAGSHNHHLSMGAATVSDGYGGGYDDYGGDGYDSHQDTAGIVGSAYGSMGGLGGVTHTLSYYYQTHINAETSQRSSPSGGSGMVGVDMQQGGAGAGGGVGMPPSPSYFHTTNSNAFSDDPQQGLQQQQQATMAKNISFSQTQPPPQQLHLHLIRQNTSSHGSNLSRNTTGQLSSGEQQPSTLLQHHHHSDGDEQQQHHRQNNQPHPNNSNDESTTPMIVQYTHRGDGDGSNSMSSRGDDHDHEHEHDHSADTSSHNTHSGQHSTVSSFAQKNDNNNTFTRDEGGPYGDTPPSLTAYTPSASAASSTTYAQSSPSIVGGVGGGGGGRSSSSYTRGPSTSSFASYRQQSSQQHMNAPRDNDQDQQQAISPSPASSTLSLSSTSMNNINIHESGGAGGLLMSNNPNADDAGHVAGGVDGKKAAGVLHTNAGDVGEIEAQIRTLPNDSRYRNANKRKKRMQYPVGAETGHDKKEQQEEEEEAVVNINDLSSFSPSDSTPPMMRASTRARDNNPAAIPPEQEVKRDEDEGGAEEVAVQEEEEYKNSSNDNLVMAPSSRNFAAISSHITPSTVLHNRHHHHRKASGAAAVATTTTIYNENETTTALTRRFAGSVWPCCWPTISLFRLLHTITAIDVVHSNQTLEFVMLFKGLLYLVALSYLVPMSSAGWNRFSVVSSAALAGGVANFVVFRLTSLLLLAHPLEWPWIVRRLLLSVRRIRYIVLLPSFRREDDDGGDTQEGNQDEVEEEDEEEEEAAEHTQLVVATSRSKSTAVPGEGGEHTASSSPEREHQPQQSSIAVDASQQQEQPQQSRVPLPLSPVPLEAAVNKRNASNPHQSSSSLRGSTSISPQGMFPSQPTAAGGGVVRNPSPTVKQQNDKRKKATSKKQQQQQAKKRLLKTNTATNMHAAMAAVDAVARESSAMDTVALSLGLDTWMFKLVGSTPTEVLLRASAFTLYGCLLPSIAIFAFPASVVFFPLWAAWFFVFVYLVGWCRGAVARAIRRDSTFLTQQEGLGVSAASATTTSSSVSKRSSSSSRRRRRGVLVAIASRILLSFWIFIPAQSVFILGVLLYDVGKGASPSSSSSSAPLVLPTVRAPLTLFDKALAAMQFEYDWRVGSGMVWSSYDRRWQQHELRTTPTPTTLSPHVTATPSSSPHHHHKLSAAVPLPQSGIMCIDDSRSAHAAHGVSPRADLLWSSRGEAIILIAQWSQILP